MGWTPVLIADQAEGPSSKQLRSYSHQADTWDVGYVNWLTHAKNAIACDAHIGVAVVSHFLKMITAISLRAATGARSRCESCGSYRMVAGACIRCGWDDPDYVAPASREGADRGAPCRPTGEAGRARLRHLHVHVTRRPPLGRACRRGYHPLNRANRCRWLLVRGRAGFLAAG